MISWKIIGTQVLAANGAYSTLEALRNALYKFKTYLLTYLLIVYLIDVCRFVCVCVHHTISNHYSSYSFYLILT